MSVDEPSAFLGIEGARHIFYNVVGVAQSGIYILKKPVVWSSVIHFLKHSLLFVGTYVKVNHIEQLFATVNDVLRHHRGFHYAFTLIPNISLHPAALATCLDKGTQVVPVLWCVVCLNHGFVNAEFSADV